MLIQTFKTAIRKRLRWYLRRVNYNRRTQGGRVPAIFGITCDPSEPWMYDVLKKVLPESKGAFIDVGVNVGQTLVKVKAIEPQRKYVGFEPNPTCVFYVRELILANVFSDCEIVPVGLFTKDGVLALNRYSPQQTDPSASLIEGFRPHEKIYGRDLVPVARFETIDELLNVGQIGVIKIDVEGAELEVVQSLLSVIKRDRPTILLEVLPVYSLENVARKERQEDLLNLLDGYSIHRIEKTESGQFTKLERINEFGIHSDLNRCDYILTPSDDPAFG